MGQQETDNEQRQPNQQPQPVHQIDFSTFRNTLVEYFSGMTELLDPPIDATFYSTAPNRGEENWSLSKICQEYAASCRAQAADHERFIAYLLDRFRIEIVRYNQLRDILQNWGIRINPITYQLDDHRLNPLLEQWNRTREIRNEDLLQLQEILNIRLINVPEEQNNDQANLPPSVQQSLKNIAYWQGELDAVYARAQEVLDEMGKKYENAGQLLAELLENYDHLVARWSSEAQSAANEAAKAEALAKVKHAGEMMADGTYGRSDWYAPRTDAWYLTVGGILGMPKSLMEHAQAIVAALESGTCSDVSTERIYTESGKTILVYRERIRAENAKLKELLSALQLTSQEMARLQETHDLPRLRVPEFAAFETPKKERG